MNHVFQMLTQLRFIQLPVRRHAQNDTAEPNWTDLHLTSNLDKYTGKRP